MYVVFVVISGLREWMILSNVLVVIRCIGTKRRPKKEMGKLVDPCLRQVFRMDVLESGTKVFSHDNTMTGLLTRMEAVGGVY